MCVTDEHRSNPASTLGVVCLGDPVVDLLANVDYEFLESLGAVAGGCFPIEQDEMSRLLHQTSKLDSLRRYAMRDADARWCG